MKRFLVVSLMLALLMVSSFSYASIFGRIGHERMIYPIVRVSAGQAVGSGTVIYSTGLVGGKLSTYILTNHHVISSEISISNVWDSGLKKDVKTERRGIVHVEIFKYRDLSTPVGTMKIEADIVAYTEREDMALLKLRFDDPVEHVATLPARDKVTEYRVLDEAIAAGCSLGWPPLVSKGQISRIGLQSDSLPYDMSSAQIIFGNSGGAMFTGEGIFIGIPSRIAAMGWTAVVPHMGLFIPVHRVFDWLASEHYDFVFDPTLTEKGCLEAREQEIKDKKARGRE